MTFDELRPLIPESEVEELEGLWESLGLLGAENPSSALRLNFYRRLHAIDQTKKRSFRARFSWLKPALVLQLAGALALFVGGIYVGRLNTTRTVTVGEVAQLKTEVQDLHQTVALSLLERQSATSRLEGISWGSRVEHPDNELLSALITTLNRDPNTNVRLASLDALERFSGEATVRTALVNSLVGQDSPLVQIALIDALVHFHDKAAAGPLEKLKGDGQVNAAVRQRAQWGLQKLTYE